MPAKASIQNYLKALDSGLRGDDVKIPIKDFYGTTKVRISDYLSPTDFPMGRQNLFGSPLQWVV